MIATALTSASQTPLWLAHDAGLYARYGLDVELQYVRTGNTLTKALMALKADFDPSGGRSGEFGKNFARVGAANRLLTLATDENGQPKDLNPQQMPELSHTFLRPWHGGPGHFRTAEMVVSLAAAVLFHLNTRRLPGQSPALWLMNTLGHSRKRSLMGSHLP